MNTANAVVTGLGDAWQLRELPRIAAWLEEHAPELSGAQRVAAAVALDRARWPLDPYVVEVYAGDDPRPASITARDPADPPAAPFTRSRL